MALTDSNGHEIIDERFARVWDRFQSTQKALDKADESLQQYKVMANEFRGVLSDLTCLVTERSERVGSGSECARGRSPLCDSHSGHTLNWGPLPHAHTRPDRLG